MRVVARHSKRCNYVHNGEMSKKVTVSPAPAKKKLPATPRNKRVKGLPEKPGARSDKAQHPRHRNQVAVKGLRGAARKIPRGGKVGPVQPKHIVAPQRFTVFGSYPA